MKTYYIVGVIIVVIFISFLFINKEVQYCENTCQEVSKQMNSNLLTSFETNNSGKREGCRCEFENGQILGFGLDKSVN
jgi:hypothetical protein